MNNIRYEDFKNYKPKEQRQYIKPISDFIDEAMEIANNGVNNVGDTLPWDKTKDKVRFDGGEVTIWTGLSSNGKSMVMGQMAVWLSKHTKVLIASMEMKGSQTTHRIMCQASGGDMSNYFRHEFENRTSLNLWLYDRTDDVESKDVLAMVDWSAEVLGIKHILIDSIMMCGIDDNDLNAQKEFVSALTTRAKKYNVHIHLVAHSRKEPVGTKHFIPSSISDIAGSSKIGNLATNILCIHLNKDKDKSERDPSGWMIVVKNRNIQWTGKCSFWYHESSYQWLEDYPMYGQPMRWL
jgi:twinkle protein